MIFKNLFQPTQKKKTTVVQQETAILNFCDEFSAVPIDIKRTNRRKSITIKIVKQQLHVIAPKRTSNNEIVNLLLRRTNWITTKLRSHAERAEFLPKTFSHDEEFLYLGQSYPLKLIPDGADRVTLHEGAIEIGLKVVSRYSQQTSLIKSRLIRWYRQRAEEYLKSRTDHFAPIIGVTPRLICIKQYKSRWGCCSINGTINYNWKIIFAPPHIIDYLVVHELCHMHEHNHSPHFWQWVEKFHPNYKQDRNWLQNNGDQLDI